MKGLLAHIGDARRERLRAPAKPPSPSLDPLEDRKFVEALVIIAVVFAVACYMAGVGIAELAAMPANAKLILGGWYFFLFWLCWRIRLWNARRKIARDHRRRVFAMMEAELLARQKAERAP